jgi:hypothetical protein
MSVDLVLGLFVGVSFIAFGLKMRRLGIARRKREDFIRGRIEGKEDVEFLGLPQKELISGEVTTGVVFVFLGLLIMVTVLMS